MINPEIIYSSSILSEREEGCLSIPDVRLDIKGSDTVVMQYQDLDGDGPDAATVTVSGSLNANTTYDGILSLQWLCLKNSVGIKI